MAQDWATTFYSSPKWKKCRNAYIQSRMLVDGGLCEQCHNNPGYIVHHKTTLTPENITDPDVCLNYKKLMYVCKECHDLFEGHGLNKRMQPTCTFDSEGQPISVREIDKRNFNAKIEEEEQRQKCYIVYGPPAGGKTTFVKANKQKGDLVVDLDYLGTAISLDDKLALPDNLLPAVFALRECLYGLIENRRIDCKNIWIIAGLPRKGERMMLRNRLGAELIYVGAEYEECVRRAELDEERKDKRKAREIIGKYFARYES